MGDFGECGIGRVASTMINADFDDMRTERNHEPEQKPDGNTKLSSRDGSDDHAHNTLQGYSILQRASSSAELKLEEPPQALVYGAKASLAMSTQTLQNSTAQEELDNFNQENETRTRYPLRVESFSTNGKAPKCHKAPEYPHSTCIFILY